MRFFGTTLALVCALGTGCLSHDASTSEPAGSASPLASEGTATADHGTAAIGQPCTANSDCAEGACLNLPSGYCTRVNCAGGVGCPSGSRCFTMRGPVTSACFKTCGSASECRGGEGYTCDGDRTCYPRLASMLPATVHIAAADLLPPAAPAPNALPPAPAAVTPTAPATPPVATVAPLAASVGCNPQNPNGACPDGQACQDGVCGTFSCSGAASPSVCAGGEERFQMSVPPKHVAILGDRKSVV